MCGRCVCGVCVQVCACVVGVCVVCVCVCMCGRCVCGGCVCMCGRCVCGVCQCELTPAVHACVWGVIKHACVGCGQLMYPLLHMAVP